MATAIYLDTSALAKILLQEAESAALLAFLQEQATVTLLSSALARLETARALLRHPEREAVAAQAAGVTCWTPE